MKTAVVLTLAVLANSLGNVFLSKGMKQFGAVSGLDGSLWRSALYGLTNPWVVLGVLLLIFFLACYMTALSWADLSFVLPATAPGYVLTAILSKYLLGETIDPLRWAGTFFIVAGTWLVTRTFSEKPATEPAALAYAAAEKSGEAAGETG